MSDYYAILKIQQGRLKAAISEAGFESVAALSRFSGINQTSIGALLNFKKSPRCKDGKWRKQVLCISEALCRDPSSLFPEYLNHEIPSNRMDAFVERAQLNGTIAKQLGPADACEDDDMNSVINEVLGTLTNRERYIMKERVWGGKSLVEIGDKMGLTREGVRQIEAKAMRKLRHPARAKKLKEVCQFTIHDEENNAENTM